ncbi:MAG: TatD family hydrolase, partial [Oscillospiraceae bacterium]|nr:TatD family hydrolase [Oscillospiraceae bacterium]
MIFETHAHYDDEQFDADRNELLSSLADGGVGLVVNPSVTAENAKKVLAMAEKYPFFYAAVGVHPENCANYDENELAQLRTLAQHPKCVAIGEIGLDYYWDENPPKEFQMEVFRRQLEMAL